jgi:hypothetical protein
MSARTKPVKSKSILHRFGWRRFKALGGRRAFGVVAALVGTLAASAAAFYGFNQLDQHVNGLVVSRTSARITLVDLPLLLKGAADVDIRERVAPLLRADWTDPALPRRMAQAVRETGWVSLVYHVRRNGDGHFQISCLYRTPVALVHKDSEYRLVDREGIVLPGHYGNDSRWKQVSGVLRPAPGPGYAWDGDDLRAGLAVIDALAQEPFLHQIQAISVENFGGRQNRWNSHVELTTDQPGGRVRWGSAPGWELEENSAAQKIAILRENFARTGRVDAHYQQIDVSTLPDRFSVPN